MPFIVQDLIKDNPNLVTVRSTAPVKHALALMVEHDFSQLPIVDGDGRSEGMMITAESILRALNNFGVGLDNLRVEHARVKVDTFRSDADLFELLDRLQATYAVLIVDGERRLTGIVTNYDTAEYFRRRAEDMMLVEDIETMVKEYILAAYQVEAGEANREKLERAVQHISGKALRRKFESALSHYLNLQSGDSQKAIPDAQQRETVFDRHFGETRQFEDLSLSEYIELLLDDKQWLRYESVFTIEQTALRNLLNKVRETRNELFHFRSEITADQRDHLRFSADWLAHYQDDVAAAFAPDATIDTSVDTTIGNEERETDVSPKTDDGDQILPIEDEAGPSESRYAPLAVWLQNQPPKSAIVELTFNEIEEIIGGDLPRSAHEHRAWWANDSVGHVQSQQWLDVGWRVAVVNFTAQIVRFARIQDRQRAYIDFFSRLNAELKQKPGYENLQPLPDGASWSWTKNAVVRGRSLGQFNFSFGRGGIFRVELYIDSGDKATNKGLFDFLYARKEAIEQELGCELHWQRLDNRRASRIARDFPGSITDNEEKLAQLRTEAIPAMVSFTNVLNPKVLEFER